MREFDLIVYGGFGVVGIALAAFATAPVAVMWG